MLYRSIQKVRKELQAVHQRRQLRMCNRKLELVIDKMLQADLSQLCQVDYIENLIRRIGLVHDTRNIYGDDEQYMNPISRGLWQIPRQLAEFAVFLSQHRIQSFIEIGTFTGYTFTFLMGYLTRFNPGLKGITVDIYDCNPIKLVKSNSFDAQFVIGTSRDFVGRSFDLCLIDGDHSLSAVSADFDNIGCKSTICAFHDINDTIVSHYPGNEGGVPQFWENLKVQCQNREFHEFISHTRGKQVMGIGVAVRCDIPLGQITRRNAGGIDG